MIAHRDLLWPAGVAGGLLLIPAFATRLSPAVHWGAGDFLVMGGLLCVALLGARLAWRHTSGPRRLSAIATVLILAVLVWAELAVGVLTTPGS